MPVCPPSPVNLLAGSGTPGEMLIKNTVINSVYRFDTNNLAELQSVRVCSPGEGREAADK